MSRSAHFKRQKFSQSFLETRNSALTAIVANMMNHYDMSIDSYQRAAVTLAHNIACEMNQMDSEAESEYHELSN